MNQLIAIIFLVSTLGFAFAGMIPLPKYNPDFPIAQPFEAKEIFSSSSAVNNDLQLNSFSFRQTIAPPTCQAGDKIAFDLLVDTSGSMSINDRMAKLKAALKAFGGSLNRDNLVGIQGFGPVQEYLPIDNFDKTKFDQAVDRLQPRGQTPMKDGFILAQNQINQARISKPGYKWVLVFMSDGLPHQGGSAPTRSQDPRDVAKQLQTSGVEIYTIGLEINAVPSQHQSYVRDIMRDSASDLNHFRETNANGIGQIYSQIGTNPCPTPPPPACVNQKVGVDFLLDMSNSTQDSKGGRLTKIKEAMIDLKSILKDDDVLGVEFFEHRVATLMGINTFSNLKSDYDSKIKNLEAGGPTLLKSALLYGQNQINQNKSRFPGRDWYLVLVTDGSYGQRPEENPVPIASQIKDNGIKIVGIWLEKEKLEDKERRIADVVMPQTVTSGLLFESSNQNLGATLKSLFQNRCN